MRVAISSCCTLGVPALSRTWGGRRHLRRCVATERRNRHVRRRVRADPPRLVEQVAAVHAGAEAHAGRHVERLAHVRLHVRRRRRGERQQRRGGELLLEDVQLRVIRPEVVPARGRGGRDAAGAAGEAAAAGSGAGRGGAHPHCEMQCASSIATRRRRPALYAFSSFEKNCLDLTTFSGVTYSSRRLLPAWSSSCAADAGGQCHRLSGATRRRAPA